MQLTVCLYSHGRPTYVLQVQSLDGLSSSTSSEDITEIQNESSKLDSPSQMIFSPVSPGIPSIFTTPASGTPHKLSVIDEASDIMLRVSVVLWITNCLF